MASVNSHFNYPCRLRVVFLFGSNMAIQPNDRKRQKHLHKQLRKVVNPRFNRSVVKEKREAFIIKQESYYSYFNLFRLFW